MKRLFIAATLAAAVLGSVQSNAHANKTCGFGIGMGLGFSFSGLKTHPAHPPAPLYPPYPAYPAYAPMFPPYGFLPYGPACNGDCFGGPVYILPGHVDGPPRAPEEKGHDEKALTPEPMPPAK